MFTAINPELATGPVKDLLDTTQRQLGRVPNLYRAMANSPAALASYLSFRHALQDGVLSVPMRERIALLVAQKNSCDYCIAAHTFRGRKIGLSELDLDMTRHAHSVDPKINAALTFIVAVLEGAGTAPGGVQDALFEHGWIESEAGEIIAHVALNVFSNYFKQLAQPELDFPAVAELG